MPEQVQSNGNQDPGERQLTAEQVFTAGHDLMQHFGIEISPTEHPDTYINALRQINPRYQGDLDHSIVRWKLEKDQKTWPEETVGLIDQAAEALRMKDHETPLVGDFDVVIVLGGARMANLDRARYVAEAIKGGEASAKKIIVAGATRPLDDAEKLAAYSYAPMAQTEADLCEAASKVTAAEAGVKSELVEVPYEIDGRRASSQDVIAAALQKAKDEGILSEDGRVAAVTTQIYQTFTQLDLDRVAKQFGVTNTHTAGNPSDPKIVEKRTASTYFTEIIRTLRAAAETTR